MFYPKNNRHLCSVNNNMNQQIRLVVAGLTSL